MQFDPSSRPVQGLETNFNQMNSPKTGSPQPSSSITGNVTAEPNPAFTMENSMNGSPQGFLSLIENPGRGISSIPKGSVEGLSPQGIDDSYTNLEPGNDEAKQIAKDNYRYAGLLQNRNKSNNFREASWEYSNIHENTGVSGEQQNFIAEVKKMGFEKGYLELNGKQNEVFYNPKTGVVFHLAKDDKNKELVVAFMGSGAQNYLLNKEGQKLEKKTQSKMANAVLKHIVRESLGGVRPAAKDAMKIGEELKKCTEGTNYTPVVIGHSHGGGLAQCAAVDNGIKGVVFNSRPMGTGMRKKIGPEKIAQNAQNVTAFSCKKDLLSGIKPINEMSARFERLTGKAVPRTLGKGYNLPGKEGTNWLNAHNDYMGQMAQLLKNKG